MKVKMTLAESCMLRTFHQIDKIKVSDSIQNNQNILWLQNFFQQLCIYMQENLWIEVKMNLNIFSIDEGAENSIRVKLNNNLAFRRTLHRLGHGYRLTRKNGLLSCGLL